MGKKLSKRLNVLEDTGKKLIRTGEFIKSKGMELVREAGAIRDDIGGKNN